MVKTQLLLNDAFANELVLVNVTFLYKKRDLVNKRNYQPISTALSLSGIFEKIFYPNN